MLYGALILVLSLHELGHLPREVRFRFVYGFVPAPYAYQGLSRIGGLVVNVALFTIIFLLEPEQVFWQFVGLAAWIHFIIYAVLGSILPEKKNSHIMDDVPNEYALLFIGLAITAFYVFGNYYLEITKVLLP